MGAVMNQDWIQGFYPQSAKNLLDRTRPYRLLTPVDNGKFSEILEYVYEDTKESVRLSNVPENQTYQMQIDDARFWEQWFIADKARIAADKTLSAQVKAEKLQRHDVKIARYAQKAHSIELLKLHTGQQ